MPIIKRSKIAIWSTKYSEVTGQGIVTQHVAKIISSDSNGCIEYIFSPGMRSQALWDWIKAWSTLWKDIYFGKVETLYLVCSRSNGGFLRDIPALLAARFGLRVIVHSHGSDIVSLLQDRRISRAARWLYRPCEMIVPSVHLPSMVNGFVRSVVVCEGFYASAEDSADRPQTQHKELRVMWNSNIMASKGFFDLVEAVKRLHERGIEIRLSSLGAPTADEEMGEHEVRRDLEILQDVAWFEHIGAVEHKDALSLLTEADVVALPSRYSSESQGLAIIEAMCAGKGILVSDIAALRATVGDYPAEFVPIRSVDAIATSLERIRAEKNADPSLFYERRTQAARNARKRYSVQRFERAIRGILLTREF
ncbi:glycosyl transferase family 1 [Loktanella sp. PT4BL]|jgi:glycosyltransferase involved in cell wall biosynthesis|uniref:glycosyltransferase family 4 protein n=1 Tax=Loktanella sp. PT4BL TaxID=2135611 RepID=UPI000D76DC6B|nr:glycosyltransferase family 4 protein [Loktanella sp. PT4BL]PXW66156.1 glycosyl transferase family 1 [Loktanella sp. PT4BL]